MASKNMRLLLALLGFFVLLPFLLESINVVVDQDTASWQESDVSELIAHMQEKQEAYMSPSVARSLAAAPDADDATDDYNPTANFDPYPSPPNPYPSPPDLP